MFGELQEAMWVIEDKCVHEKAVDYRSQGRVVSGCSSGVIYWKVQSLVDAIEAVTRELHFWPLSYP